MKTMSVVLAGTVAIVLNGPIYAQEIGVPSCDTFIKSYESCIKDNVPAAQQEVLKSSINQMRASIKQVADNPQTKASAPAMCEQMSAQMKASVASYGCKF